MLEYGQRLLTRLPLAAPAARNSGCCAAGGEFRLDLVPSGQMIASPVNTPRRPSSQLTSEPCLVQACAVRSLNPCPLHEFMPLQSWPADLQSDWPLQELTP